MSFHQIVNHKSLKSLPFSNMVMEKSFLEKIFEHHQQCSNCPTTLEVAEFFNELLGVLFPNFSSKPAEDLQALELSFQKSREHLAYLMKVDVTMETIGSFFDSLPELYQLLQEDITAIFEGDPASESREEVVRSYPGFYALAAYRIANQLYRLEIDLIPRSITEYAHGKTGIDIHPAATIGRRFCIDHGTGIVIGETTEIGDDVKIYQGVTLGALSVEKTLANTKRHPTIGNRVVIYAGATVLGGNTTIGDDSIIGGNVWLTESISPSTQVYYKAPNIHKMKSFN